MTSPIHLLLRTCVIIFPALCIIGAPLRLGAEKRPGHDRLAAALELLNEAKKSRTPIPLLTNARVEVEGTLMPHLQTQHDNAIKAINHAIDGALHEVPKEKERIEHAIETVRALMGLKPKK